MIQLTTTGGCSALRGNETGTEYIFNLIGQGEPVNTMPYCCYRLELSYNCCEPVVYYLPIAYQLTLSLHSIDETRQRVALNIQNVNSNCNFEVFWDTGGQEVALQLSTGRRFFFSPAQFGSNIPFKFYVVGCGGVRYTFEGTYSTDSNSVSNFVINTQTFTVPDIANTYPFDFSTTGATGVIDLGLPAFGLTGNRFPSGIYYIALYQDNVPVTDSLFLDCSNIQCDIVKHLACHPNSQVWTWYRALQYADQCNILTLKEKCDIWRYLALELGYLQLNNDCGCNS